MQGFVLPLKSERDAVLRCLEVFLEALALFSAAQNGDIIGENVKEATKLAGTLAQANAEQVFWLC
jgi:hypothetical protein